MASASVFGVWVSGHAYVVSGVAIKGEGVSCIGGRSNSVWCD